MSSERARDQPLTERALSLLRAVATSPEPDPEQLNELFRCAHTLGTRAHDAEPPASELGHELELFCDDLRMGRTMLGAHRAVLLRKALQVLDAALRGQPQSRERTEAVTRELHALREQ